MNRIRPNQAKIKVAKPAVGSILISEINLGRTGSSRRQILWPSRASVVAAVVYRECHAGLLR
jgi:hypothetical protein